jgi:lysophospholipase L1-like esterase
MGVRGMRMIGLGMALGLYALAPSIAYAQSTQMPAPHSTAPADMRDCAVADNYFAAMPTFPKLRAALMQGDNVKIIVVGGASTLGRAAGDSDKSWPARMGFYLTRAFPNASVTIINKSVARSTAQDFVQHFDADIAATAPSMVIWETGVSDMVRSTNLEDFRRALHKGIKRMRASVPESFLMDMQYGRTNDFLNNANRYLNVMHNVADQSGVSIFPRNDIMRDWAEQGLFNYDVKGQDERRALATKLYDCLGQSVASFITRSQNEAPPQ